MINKLAGKRMLSYLYQRQKGLCPQCRQKITEQTGWNAHHLIPRHLGGRWTSENLVLMHPVCHIQVHQQAVTDTASVLTTGVKSA